MPKALFFGRHARNKAAANGAKEDVPDYPPPPPFVPLTPASYKSATPGLLHAFYAERLEKGGTLEADDAFDPAQATIGPLGQIVQKAPPGNQTTKKKDGGEQKKKPAKKIAQPGVGKGNWIRPSKEERERRAAEKKALLEKQRLEEEAKNKENGDGGEEDAEGKED